VLKPQIPLCGFHCFGYGFHFDALRNRF
jgi:hypothetical protein